MSDLPLVGVLHQPYGAVALREIYMAANGLCQPTVILRQSVAEVYPNLVEIARTLFPVHILPAEGIANAVAGLGLQGVTTFHDAELELAEEVAEALGLPGLAQPGTNSTSDRRLPASASRRCRRQRSTRSRASLKRFAWSACPPSSSRDGPPEAEA